MLDGAWPEAGWRHSLAAELDLPMTAFARLRDGGDWDLRWFRTLGEEQFYGHAARDAGAGGTGTLCDVLFARRWPATACTSPATR